MEPIDHITHSAQEVRLSAEASRRIRSRLLSHMREHPITAVYSPYQRFFVQSPFIALLRKPVAALALVLIVGVGGVTSYAAGGSLPGDALYPIKVSVIEPVTGVLAVSSEAKAAWHVALAETRVREVEELAAHDKLTPEQSEKGQEVFDQSYGVARATLDTLALENPNAAARLDESLTASIDAHETALTAIADVASTSNNAIQARSFAFYIRSKSHGRGPGEDSDAARGKEGGVINAAAIYPTATLMATTAASTTLATTTATTTASTTPPEDDRSGSSTDEKEESFFHKLGF
jgi:hypothetical protein